MQWFICDLIYFKVVIDNLEFCCMDPDMEHHYRELLHQWKHDEDNIKDELKEIGIDVKEIGTDVKEIGTDVKETGIDVKEISTDVKEIGTDVKDLTKKLDDLVASTGTPAGQSSDEDGEYNVYRDCEWKICNWSYDDLKLKLWYKIETRFYFFTHLKKVPAPPANEWIYKVVLSTSS